MKRTYTIPVGNLSREDAEKEILKLMNLYNTDVTFDDSLWKKYYVVQDRKKKLERIYGKEELDNGRC